MICHTCDWRHFVLDWPDVHQLPRLGHEQLGHSLALSDRVQKEEVSPRFSPETLVGTYPRAEGGEVKADLVRAEVTKRRIWKN